MDNWYFKDNCYYWGYNFSNHTTTKKEENSVKRLARREYVLIKEAISIQDKESYEQLESFNSMLAIVSDNQILVAISEKVGNILKKYW